MVYCESGGIHFLLPGDRCRFVVGRTFSLVNSIHTGGSTFVDNMALVRVKAFVCK